ncbi:hypothetical protein [Spirosoma flavum]|uniref:Uncharacterized protein n=1 Tax=Spirosoma flavum TaxID=2048557 RepID=A0ABW6AMJ0_9BACT
MHIFRLFLFVIGFSFSQGVQAQWRLLYQSKDIANAPDTTSPIKLIESRGALSKYIVVHFSNHEKILVLKKDIWGYADGSNRIWRSYDKEFYLVTSYNGAWVDYVVDRLVANTRNQIFQPLYSRTLDSRISAIWTKAMSDVSPSYRVR